MRVAHASHASWVAIPSRGFTWFGHKEPPRLEAARQEVAIPSRGFTWFERDEGDDLVLLGTRMGSNPLTRIYVV